MAFAYLTSTVSPGLGASGGATPAIDTTGATLIVVAVSRATANGTFSDSQGNTWILLKEATQVNVRVSWYYVINPTTNASHTFSYTGTNVYPAVAVSAYSGTSVTIDNRTFNRSAAVSALAPGTTTPIKNNSLIISFEGYELINTQAVTESMTIRVNHPWAGGVDLGVALADKIQTTATAINPSWSGGVSTNRLTGQVVFYENPTPSTAFEFIDSVAAIPGASGGVTTAIDTTGATLIIVAVSHTTTDGTFTDSAGNTWVEIHQQTQSSVRLSWWYVINPTTSATHTFSYTGSSIFPTINAAAYSGVDVVFDAKSIAGSSSSSSQAPGSITPAEDASLIVSVEAIETISEQQLVTETLSVRENDPWQIAVNLGLASASRELATAAAINPTWSSAATNKRIAAMAVFSATVPVPANGRIPLVVVDGVVQQLQSTDFLTGVVNSSSNFTIDTALIIADGTGSKDVKQSSTLTESSVSTVISDTATNTTNIATNTVNITGILGDYVSAAAAFATDNVVLRSDGTSRGAQASAAVLTDDGSFYAGTSNTISASTSSFIGSGTLNDITSTSTYGVIGGGNNNDITASIDSVIGGGTLNSITSTSDYGTVGGGNNNDITTSTYSTISGGFLNKITGSTQSSITGGAACTITSSQQTTVTGGSTNVVLNARRSVITGGLSNTITSPSANGSQSSVIVGGQSHTITTSQTATVVGGNTNVITAGSNSSIIAAGSSNTITGSPNAAIISGSSNTITTGTGCTIVGGVTGSITTSIYATVAGGQRNAISSGADYSTAIGGQDNTITGGWSTCAGGRQSECGGTYAMMIGFRGKSRLSGELAHSSGRHDTTNGSAQWSQFIVFNTTTNATGTKLFLDTGTAPMTIPDNASWIFDIDLLGMETDGTNTNAYNIKGAVRRDGTAVGAFVGTPTVTTIGEDDATWGVPTIAVPSNRMEITVNGLAATTINWTAVVNVTQVIVES